MIAVVITLKSATALPPVYVVRRILGSAPAFFEEQALQAYLEGHAYRRIHKPFRSDDRWIGLWASESDASDDRDDKEAVVAFIGKFPTI